MGNVIWQPIELSKEEIEWQEQRQQERDKMLNAFAIPWTMLGDMTVEGSAVILDEPLLLQEGKQESAK